jgi:hypothetical protein
MKRHLIPMEELPESLSSYGEHIECHAIHIIADEYGGGTSFIYANALVLKSRTKNQQRGALALLACEGTAKPMLPQESETEEFLERNFGHIFKQAERLIEAVQLSNYSIEGVLEKVSGLVRGKRLKALLCGQHCVLIPGGLMEVASVETPPLSVWTPTCARTTVSTNHLVQPNWANKVRHLPSHENPLLKAA